MGGHKSRLWSRDAETVTKGTWGEGLDWLPFQFTESRTQGKSPGRVRREDTQIQKSIKSKEAQRDKADAMCHQNPRF